MARSSSSSSSSSRLVLLVVAAAAVAMLMPTAALAAPSPADNAVFTNYIIPNDLNGQPVSSGCDADADEDARLQARTRGGCRGALKKPPRRVGAKKARSTMVSLPSFLAPSDRSVLSLLLSLSALLLTSITVTMHELDREQGAEEADLFSKSGD